MNRIVSSVYRSPVGELILGVFQDRLCLCDWRYRRMRAQIDRRICHQLDAMMVEGQHEVLDQAAQQLSEYFALQRKDFDLPLLMVGSAFQQAVWQQLLGLDYGQRTSYGELALNMGRPSAVRAVASANGANALAIMVPCHRVLASDGALIGYAGGLPAKRKLLALELSQSDFCLRPPQMS